MTHADPAKLSLSVRVREFTLEIYLSTCTSILYVYKTIFINFDEHTNFFLRIEEKLWFVSFISRTIDDHDVIT